jgi:carbon storage regulator
VPVVAADVALRLIAPLHPSFFGKESAMLVLSRKLQESIVIGDDIVITVIKLEGKRVRIGIAAPKGVPVRRREVVGAVDPWQRTTPRLGC